MKCSRSIYHAPSTNTCDAPFPCLSAPCPAVAFLWQVQQELFEQGQELPVLNDENANDLGTDPATQDLDIPELMEEINNDDYESTNNDEAMMDDYSAILN